MYLCPLVGSIKLATIINLPSGSPSSLSYTQNPVQDCAAMRCYQSAGSLLTRTTVATPSMRTSSTNPGEGACWGSGSYRCADVSAMHHSTAPALTGGLEGWMALPAQNIQARAQSRAPREAHEKPPDWLFMSMGAQKGGN